MAFAFGLYRFSCPRFQVIFSAPSLKQEKKRG